MVRMANQSYQFYRKADQRDYIIAEDRAHLLVEAAANESVDSTWLSVFGIFKAQV